MQLYRKVSIPQILTRIVFQLLTVFFLFGAILKHPGSLRRTYVGKPGNNTGSFLQISLWAEVPRNFHSQTPPPGVLFGSHCKLYFFLLFFRLELLPFASFFTEVAVFEDPKPKLMDRRTRETGWGRKLRGSS